MLADSMISKMSSWNQLSVILNNETYEEVKLSILYHHKYLLKNIYLELSH